MSIFRNAKRLLFRKNLIVEELDKQYIIGVIKIKLPFDHALPTYQSQYRLYDKFLPFLVASLGDDGIIIDIGANVGDTAIAMAQHCTNRILSIEPDAIYYNFLVANVREANLQNRICTANYAIGDSGKTIALTRSSGTATPAPDNSANGIPVSSLRDVLLAVKLNNEHIRLLKCDTDGFDYEILLGSLGLIGSHKPLLYWENTVEESEHLRNSNRLICELKNLGYSGFACFDNFGSLLYTGRDIDIVKQLNAYLLFQRQAGQVVVYYYDILAWVDADMDGTDDCIEKYRKFSKLA